MGNDTAKFRFKIGQLEVEYEGSEIFIKDGLINLMKKAMSFYSENKDQIPTGTATKGESVTGTQPGNLNHSTNTIAAHLGGNTGPELAIAAAAHLLLVKGKSKFSRKEINDEMKEATTYYKSSMSSNLSKTLNTLVKGKRFNQVSKDTYSLPANENRSIEARLAEII